MKKYIKELIILIIQLLIFYLLPLTAGPADGMGLVVLILLSTFILSVVLGIISRNKLKFLYPIIIAVLFLPTVPLYYNESAIVHALWYLVDSLLGILLGTIIHKLSKMKK